MTIISLDGIKIRVKQPDIDGDGKVGGVEEIEQRFTGDSGIAEVQQPTELGETLRELNDDTIDNNTRMSGIDMRANLHPYDEPSILAMDGLVAFKFLPSSCLALTRQKKRLSVSIAGRGRSDIVSIVAGKRDHEENVGSMGFFNKAKTFMGINGNNP